MIENVRHTRKSLFEFAYDLFFVAINDDCRVFLLLEQGIAKIRSLGKNQTPIHRNSKNPRYAIDY